LFGVGPEYGDRCQVDDVVLVVVVVEAVHSSARAVGLVTTKR